MKTLNYMLVGLLLAFVSCNSGVKESGQKVTFGIYEIVNAVEIPQSVKDTLKSKGVIIKSDRQPMMGYVKKSDSTALSMDLTGQNFKLFRTIAPVDKNQQYDAIVAVRIKPAIDNSDINKTKASGNRVEIDFNYGGAKKWAAFSKKNVGHWVAFVINHRIYSTPMIIGEMKIGVALITGLKDAKSAKNISKALNSSTSD